MVIIVIHGILKSITDNLENTSISQIIYFVQYILIVTLIMSNFTEIIKIVKETESLQTEEERSKVYRMFYVGDMCR